MDQVGQLVPAFEAREAWTFGLVVVLAVLRPVGRRGWLAAAALLIVAVGALGTTQLGGPAWPVLATVGALSLAGLLALTAVTEPLRWEPRTGPSAATALIAGALVVHVSVALHTADVLALLSVAAIVFGAERLGRRWGYVGTARCTAAAVAWAPPLILGYRSHPTALVAAAALVWSWWALVEMWGGRHRPGRLAATSGVLFGAAVVAAPWSLVATPPWVRRLSARTAGWFAGGALAAFATAAAGLMLVDRELPGLPDLSTVNVVAVGVVAAVATAAFAVRRPLSPTRLSAVTAALLLTALPWWLAGDVTAGPVAAMPFVLLAAVAPDRPEERWPPDAAVPGDARAEVGA
ncbi:MAG: hypothetical protein KY462_00060 [Actinobacteria bacterium]|nr:hypothetical protein [Actinomycetota bacterium]